VPKLPPSEHDRPEGFLASGVRPVNLHGFGRRADAYGTLTGTPGKFYHPEHHHALVVLKT
jgi:hypothetical protein